MALSTPPSVHADFLRDGAIVLRRIVDDEWIQKLREAVDSLMKGSVRGRNIGSAGEGRFFADSFCWLQSEVVAEFVRSSGLGQLAGTIMNCDTVRLFSDQLLVKEPGALKRTPWHQDLPYWPVSGGDMLTIWVPIDPATAENGVVTYVRGSHQWPKFHGPDSFTDDQSSLTSIDITEGGGIRAMDLDTHPERFDLLSWDVEPGDVIVHHPLVVHGAPGNRSSTDMRRALATRWFGNGVRWDDTRPNFMQRFKGLDDFPYPSLTNGELAEDDRLFPVVWNRHSMTSQSRIAP